MKNLILPKQLDDGLVPGRHLIFFVGPIKGGGDWQRTACEMLWHKLPDAYIVVPCRWESDHPLYRRRIDGPEDAFERQTHWERHYLNQAGGHVQRGCIIGWLPCENKEKPRNDGQPYGRDSYGEVGEWRGRMMCQPGLRFVLGAEKGFPGLNVMKSNFEGALPGFKIHSTLEETIDAAIARSEDPPVMPL